MSTLTKTWPLVERSYKYFTSRNIHMTTLLSARPRPSPKLRKSSQTPPPSSGSAIRVQKQYDPNDCLPPIALLESASKLGALPIKPQAAQDFLLQYQMLGNSSSQQKLFAEHHITPSTMAVLADVLRRCTGAGQRSLAKKLMVTASALGDKSATLELILSALNTRSLSEYTVPLQRLGLLAKKENDPQAMMVLGKVLYVQGVEREALAWFRKATQPPNGSLGFDGANDALVSEGRILLNLNDKEGARKAFEKAALELDDPTAYFYLSKFEAENSSKQKEYLLKAATAGVKEAWHNLGVIELAEIEKNEKKPTSIADYGMAREWFHVAAADGFGLSMLNLASMYRVVGELDESLSWLDKAEGVAESRAQAQNLKRQWST